ncbi:MAG: L-rhamnose/proton symporter RhaT [Sedimentisphaerales bacterium]|nr:L-rhamnose/proton symporter RhaT [Sedimentisphaerales bacterium]
MIGLGVFLHAVGGFAAGSFYIPFKKVRNWAWESYWLVGGVFSWIVMPWLIALLVVPNLFSILIKAPPSAIFWTYLFGVLWGIGGLTFGLSMRYLGMSLGYAIALGFCAAFGTIIPPIFRGEFGGLATQTSGQVTLAGIFICLVGIAICGWAGVSKEREMPDEKKKEAIKEFNFVKGLWVAIFAGVMSACMIFGIEAGEAISDLAFGKDSTSLWKVSPIYIFVFAGGFTTNLLWCIYLNIKNRSTKDYIDANKAPLVKNYVFSTLAGITWYLQFMFFGMGKTRMGDYDFSSWTIHMAFIIIFSNIWGLIFREWKGSSKRTHKLIVLGLFTLVASICVVGVGNYLKKTENQNPNSTQQSARVIGTVHSQ